MDYEYYVNALRLGSEGSPEICEPEEAEFWGAYRVHHNTASPWYLLSEWLADFETKAEAEKYIQQQEGP